MNSFRLNVASGDVALAKRGMPAEGWHVAELDHVLPSNSGRHVYFVFRITAGPDAGLTVRDPFVFPRDGESADVALRRLRVLRTLGLVDDDADGDITIDVASAIGKQAEIEVVHVKDEKGRVFANLSFFAMRPVTREG